MADITKCANSEDCELKDNCYRHTANDGGDRQSWGYFAGKNCEDYLPNKELSQ